ncbi:uncharacterized protein K452DRAFT_292126 [Aplosporella prunicola CBS 121167]|uniref:Uncharacterized protein n=1 Tax=Aplosporella prunicola CBS 121167 TaxID=1176127 RepID=A0A6A6AWL7_9PEZI|nr:uncharacterized protein K452DRAFT_292666 [Aplosporella prunicola CBS 121167]XP_033392524.1 uncharacterized protein K452DRAFT_292126 [Aplosporella prunicola CBS 121167]KAF2136120.1 hypothetical protein K452DRAFT_292666 [Aplosporella prunicola CBS 121167]KAF2136806.1 hypothetical protein K452DRAFT_292126 [Aplosporella prunicola CBS 121167]
MSDGDRYVSIQCGSRCETIDISTIQTYLPAAERVIGHSNWMDMDRYTASSRPLIEGILTQRAVQETTQEFLKHLRQADHAGSQETDRALALWLDQCALQDSFHTRSRVRRQETFATFLCLADMSRRFGSPRLAALLARFFAAHADVILHAEPARTLLLWAWAITISDLTEREQLAFLQKFVRARPDVVLEERYYTHANVPERQRLWRAFMRALGDGDDDDDGYGGYGYGYGGGYGGAAVGAGRYEQRGRAGDCERRRSRSRSRVERWRCVREGTRSRSRHLRLGGGRRGGAQLIGDGGCGERERAVKPPPRPCRGRNREARDGVGSGSGMGQAGLLRCDVGQLTREVQRMGMGMGRPFWADHYSSLGWEEGGWCEGFGSGFGGQEGLEGWEVCLRW